VLVDGVGASQAVSMTDRGVRLAQQQSNEFGFIPDSHSDFPFAVYVDWPVLATLSVAAVGAFIWLRWLRSRH
jgi:hypothetical protein